MTRSQRRASRLKADSVHANLRQPGIRQMSVQSTDSDARSKVSSLADKD